MKKALPRVCKISGKMKSATTFFVVAFDIQKAKKSPAQGGAKLKLFLDTVHYIKQLDKTSILIKFLNTLIG